MIEYRTYDGDAAEIAAFTQRVWRGFFRGRSTILLWDPAYLDWQLLSESNDRHYLVGAYEGTRLVGSLFAKPYHFRLRDLSFDAAMSSWLTVDPEFQGRGVARGLALEQQRRMQERRCRFLLGFGLSGPLARGTRFWASFRDHTVLGGSLCLWAHAIDLAAVARAEASLEGRLGARLLRLAHGDVRVPRLGKGNPTVTVRPYAHADLPACMAVLERTAAPIHLAYRWDAEQLAHQLDFRGVPTTLVAERSGAVVGLVNYHQITLHSRESLRGAIVDHVACAGLETAEQVRLLQTALVEMHKSGVQVALTSRASGASGVALFRAGFVPIWPGLRLIFYTDGSGIPVHTVRTLQVHVV